MTIQPPENNDHSPDPMPSWQSSPEATVLLPTVEFEPELTTLPLSRAIFRLAGPAIISMWLIMIFNLIDAWWVGKLGAEPFAGVSAASFIYWALQSVATLVSTGVTAMVARFVGARDPHRASLVAGQGVVLACILAGVFAIGGFVLQTPTYGYMGLEGKVLESALQYLSYILAGLLPVFLWFEIDAVFRGTGDTKTPLKLITIALALNMVLDPFLIFGLGPFPRLEAGGAALATVISHALAVVLGIYILQKRDVKILFASPAKCIDPDIIWRISRIGAPIAFSGLMFSVSYMLLTRIITKFGPEPLAALGLGHRIEGVSYFTAVGFALAAETLVGQNLGAKKPDRAEKSAWQSLLYISGLLLVVSVCYYIFAEKIFFFFLNDQSVVTEGAAYLRTIALFEVFLGFEIVLEGAFSGAGNSMPPMLVSVPLTWARIPLAIFLADYLGMGSQGIWWAISITTGLKGIILAFWFKKGRWKYKNV